MGRHIMIDGELNSKVVQIPEETLLCISNGSFNLFPIYSTNKFLEKFKSEEHPVRQSIELANGVTLSIQASMYHYCSPRENIGFYTSVEVAADRLIEDFQEYIDDDSDKNFVVYAYVSVGELDSYIKRSGGIIRLAERI